MTIFLLALIGPMNLLAFVLGAYTADVERSETARYAAAGRELKFIWWFQVDKALREGWCICQTSFSNPPVYWPLAVYERIRVKALDPQRDRD